MASMTETVKKIVNQTAQAAQAQKNSTPSQQAVQQVAAQAKQTPNVQQQASPYSGLQGVSQNTAQQLGNAQQGYKQSDTVAQAMANLQAIQDQKPQGYNSKYSEKLDSLLQQITNPEKFKYSFNGDEMFKYYADLYTQKGKQAAQDTMGQAAALTGGYGNSYAQQAANQQYQQYLLGLYDKGMEMQNQAWDRYKYGQQQLADQYNTLQGADQIDYGRYTDAYNNWMNERQYATDRYDTEYNRDYGQYTDNLNYWTQMATAENGDYWNAQNMAEQKRQWDQQFEYNKMSDDRKYYYDQATAILANGKLPTDTLLKKAGISKTDAKRMMKQTKTSGGGGGRSKQPTKQDLYNAADAVTVPGVAGVITGGLVAPVNNPYVNYGIQDSRTGRKG